MERLGLFMEFKLMEIENDWDMDAGELGPERKLYYRELIARFAHHLGFYWNVGEENDNTPAQRKAFGQSIAATDAYKHLIVIHNIGGWERLYRPLMGKASAYKGASLQIDLYDVYDVTRFVRMAADLAGSPWVVFLDETRPGPAGMALGQVNAAVARDVADPEHDEGRKGALWANIMAGGAGMNTYVGFGTDVGEKSTTSAKVDVPDLMLEDFRTYDKWWDQMRAAHEFFVGNGIPFQDMTNRSELLSTGWALEGKGILVAYFPRGPVGGIRGSADGRSYAPPFPGSERRAGRGAAIDAPAAGGNSSRERKAALVRLARTPVETVTDNRPPPDPARHLRRRRSISRPTKARTRCDGTSEEGRGAPGGHRPNADGGREGLGRSGSPPNRSQP